jgi:hypothetical protein
MKKIVLNPEEQFEKQQVIDFLQQAVDQLSELKKLRCQLHKEAFQRGFYIDYKLDGLSSFLADAKIYLKAYKGNNDNEYFTKK